MAVISSRNDAKRETKYRDTESGVAVLIPDSFKIKTMTEEYRALIAFLTVCRLKARDEAAKAQL